MKDPISGLKDAPAWFLLGLAVATTALYVIDPLYARLPEDVRPYLPATTLILWVLTVFRAAAALFGARAARAIARRDYDRSRFLKVYRPIVTLFVDRHLVGSTAVSAPRFRHRVKNALDVWNSRTRLRSRTRGAWKALGDRQIHKVAEMEYGGSFPLPDIIKIARENRDIVDPDLLRMIRLADRSQYEEHDRDILTDEELELVEYVFAEHDRLEKLTRF